MIIANLDLMMGWRVLDPSMRVLAVALVMAALSPIMAAFGGDGDKPEIPRGEARGETRHRVSKCPFSNRRQTG